MTIPVRELSITERIDLVADLWDSISLDLATLPADDLQREELDARLAAYRLRRRAVRSGALEGAHAGALQDAVARRI